MQGQAAETGNVVPLTVPSAPRSLRAVGADGQATLTWRPPASTGGAAIVDYRIEYSVDGMTWTTVDDGISTTTSNSRGRTDERDALPLPCRSHQHRRGRQDLTRQEGNSRTELTPQLCPTPHRRLSHAIADAMKERGLRSP